jgi:predicted GIY-YIG superfamily endonuclease
MISIYILKCEEDRFYVGKTERDSIKRIEEHFTNCGSEWTKRYKPINVIEIIENADEMDEDKYTKIYMKKYGIENVRGGSYTRINLEEYQIKALQNELCTIDDLCFICMKKGHFAKNCSNYNANNEKEDDKKSNNIINRFFNGVCNILKYVVDESEESDESIICYKCGRENHYANRCYAIYDVDGRKIFNGVKN